MIVQVWSLWSSLMVLIVLTFSDSARSHGIVSVFDPDSTSTVSLRNIDFMFKCCKLNVNYPREGSVDSQSLMVCVNESSSKQERFVLDRIHKESEEEITSYMPRVGLFTFGTTNIWGYSAFSFAINEIYAEQNGYIMKHFDENSLPLTSESDVGLDVENMAIDQYDKDSRWNKVLLLRRSIDTVHGWAKELDYVMWIDADAVIMDVNMQIEAIMADHPHADIVVSSEHAGSSTLINSGIVIVRNSEWSRAFLRQWWIFKNRGLYSDQEQFDLLYKQQTLTLGEEFTKHIAILPPDALNSDPPAMTRQKKYNQVLHLMGEHARFRIKAFETGLRDMCQNLEFRGDKPYLQHQLGMTRERLLIWTIEKYGSEARLLMQDYEEAAVTGDNGIGASRAMANSVHHYAHALTAVGTEVSLELLKKEVPDMQVDLDKNRGVSYGLRVRVYTLLTMNIKYRRRVNDDYIKVHRRVMDEWPELLKIVAEAGQQLLSLGTMEDRKRVGKEVMALLEEIMGCCHRDQRRAVMLMVSHMHSEIGLIHLQEKSNVEALEEFQRGLIINREIAGELGDHILVTPLMAVANAYSAVFRYSEAFPLYQEAISITEMTLGNVHESLGQHLLNFGIALVHSGNYANALEMLNRAMDICRRNGILQPQSQLTMRLMQFIDLAKREKGEMVGRQETKKKVFRRKKRKAEEL